MTGYVNLCLNFLPYFLLLLLRCGRTSDGNVRLVMQNFCFFAFMYCSNWGRGTVSKIETEKLSYFKIIYSNSKIFSDAVLVS
jgi:hypothetical protein